MDSKIKILAIEDDVIFQEVLQTVFIDYQFQVVDSGEDGLKVVRDFIPDIILLDINLPGIDGYQTCQKLKNDTLTCNIPVLFLSQYHALEDRLKAYGVGGVDYISKPIDKKEVLIKVDKHIQNKFQIEKMSNNLRHSNTTLKHIQGELSDIQIIGNFLQKNSYYHDFNSLFNLFFETTRELEIRCTLQISDPSKMMVFSDHGSIIRLEKEILQMSGSKEHVFLFGKDSAIFNWKYARLLVRNLGSRTDILIILMNALNASIQVILAKQELLRKLSNIEEQNLILEKEIPGLFSQMSQAIRTNTLLLEKNFELDADVEDKLNDNIQFYQQLINNKLNSSNQQIKQVIDELRIPMKLDQEQGDVDESIRFI